MNRQRADGCFDGTLYYGRAVAGVVPGYPAIPDAISSSAMNFDTGDFEASRWIQTKIAWSSVYGVVSSQAHSLRARDDDEVMRKKMEARRRDPRAS